MSLGSVLVTGGAGYIGSHVCRALKKRGFTPIVLDNLSHGYRSFVQFGPLIEGDIGDPEVINSLCKEYQPCAAIHFAALIEVAESVRFPELYIHNNYDKAQILFESLQRNHVEAIVFSSTAAVYGIPSHTHPLTEEDALSPVNPYGVSKLKTEIFLRQETKLRSVCLRYFNAAGALPAEHLGEAHWPESHLIPNALLSLLQLKSDSLKVFGNDYPTKDGTALRDYIHILDLADAHIRALEYVLEGRPNLVVNLGSGSGNTVKDVLDTIQQITKKQLSFELAPRRTGDPPCLVANNRKAFEILGWAPQHDLEDIIRSAYQWHASPLYNRLINSVR